MENNIIELETKTENGQKTPFQKINNDQEQNAEKEIQSGKDIQKIKNGQELNTGKEIKSGNDIQKINNDQEQNAGKEINNGNDIQKINNDQEQNAGKEIQSGNDIQKINNDQEQNAGKEINNGNNRIKKILIIFGVIILLIAIIIPIAPLLFNLINNNTLKTKDDLLIDNNTGTNSTLKTKDDILIDNNTLKTKDDLLIDNNNEKNKGILELINEDSFTIKKDLLKNINSFIVCLGEPGTGKSTFGNNYYKMLYKVKNNYFESSDNYESVTKGIWIISNEERRKIPKYINRDFLDVEGFQIDDSKSWKYVIIIAFLSTDIIILNKSSRYDEVKKILKIIENSLKRMRELNIPRILKNIYIQTIKSPKNQQPIEKLLKIFNYDEDIFQMIKFKLLFLPKITEIEEGEEEKELLDYSKYKKYFEQILDLLNKTNNYNAVDSLINYIDMFNKALNGEKLFNSQTILNDIETDFNGVYNSYEKQLKRELLQKIPNFKKLDNLDETFEDFINKQINLTFKFNIANEDFTFYGSSKNYNNIYEDLKKNKTFRIEPKDIFYDLYLSEKLKLESQRDKSKEEINNIFLKKKQDINNYFALLKFYQKIDHMDLELKINTDQINYKLEKEKELEKYFIEKIKEKEKEWEDQIVRAKWKSPVQAYGEMKCENGHDLEPDVICSVCNQTLYWVDSDEKFAICKGCNKVRKLSGILYCQDCGALAKSQIKWIKGYKP